MAGPAANLFDMDSKPAGYYDGGRREDVLVLVPSEACRVLDIGCAGGRFGADLKAVRPVEVWGVEPSAQAAATAAQRLDRVLQGPVEACLPELPTAYFNCLVLNDVLEHLYNPWVVLRDLGRCLVDRGWIVVTLPNLRNYHTMHMLVKRGDFQYADAGVMDKTHVRFFTRKSGVRMLETCGYGVVRVVGLNPWELPAKFHIRNWLRHHADDDMTFDQFAFVARKREPAGAGQ